MRKRTNWRPDGCAVLAAEVAAYIDAHVSERDEHGHPAGVRVTATRCRAMW
jgi:hypothetical protein